jgi:hypothetical protein
MKIKLIFDEKEEVLAEFLIQIVQKLFTVFYLLKQI